ncbi:unnamed protein product [Candida verbasci]|uniref:RNA polymerase II-associated protein RBA50 n=1 Tax=Candida verbasci TaxID=1227364 RepID=A0A9W4XN37_9ASCO|nr:unnamed protein product [Candida verbasci]
MDVGDIIEHDIEIPNEPLPPIIPEPQEKNLKVSRWKQQNKDAKKEEPKKEIKKAETKGQLSESENIHQENLDKLSQMSQDEILQERQELLEGLNPKLVESLINRSKKREDKHDHHQHAEGYNGWIGGMKTSQGVSELSQLDKEDVDKALGINNLSMSDKKVSFDKEVKTIDIEDLDESVQLDPNGWEDVDEMDEMIPNNQIAPDDFQINHENETVHFLKPKEEELDLNDPEFYNKLHEKYYPDLPKETAKLSWMTTPRPKKTNTEYESISDLRFDFKGNLIELEDESNDNLGLHHHSESPQLAGYTLSELAHLSRSTMASQRCISIQTLGRIMHKLGLHKYNIVDVEDEEVNKMMENFEGMIWGLIDELRIVETLTEAADEKKTKNLSVRNYAIDALWLYRSGGGRP